MEFLMWLVNGIFEFVGSVVIVLFIWYLCFGGRIHVSLANGRLRIYTMLDKPSKRLSRMFHYQGLFRDLFKESDHSPGEKR